MSDLGKPNNVPVIARENSDLQFEPRNFEYAFRILTNLRNEAPYLNVLMNSITYIFLALAWMSHLLKFLLIKLDVLLTIILAQNERIYASKPKYIEKVPGCRTHPSKAKMKQCR